MTATAAQILQVRRMTNEPDDEGTYDDEAIAAYIEAYPLVDENGEAPRVPDELTGEMEENPDWTATYDLHAAAADIWDEKAAVVAGDFDFSADGGSYTRSQAYQQMMQSARYHRSRRSPKTIEQVPDKAAERSYENTL
jgi:hypothetical protein